MRTTALMSRFLFALSLVSSGCSTIQKPTASLKSADVGDVTVQGFTANFSIDVANPNSFAVPLRNTDYTLSLGGAKVADGAIKPDASLPAGGTLPMTIPVRLTFEDLLKAEEAIRAGGGEVPYRFDGKLHLGGKGSSALLGLPTDYAVPLRYSGTLSLRKVFADPAVLLNNPAARRLAGKGLDSLLNR
jgi:LEA14-like dessication related protein